MEGGREDTMGVGERGGRVPVVASFCLSFWQSFRDKKFLYIKPGCSFCLGEFVVYILLCISSF